jgi:Flp pilus assembly protein TadG
MIGRIWNSLRRYDRGSAIIETALVLPILLLVVFGITEWGRALMTTNILNQAAREGARIAAVAADSSGAVARINQVLTAANVTPAAISVVGPGAGEVITVTVDADFTFLSAKVLPNRGTITLRGTAVMRFEG